MHSLNKITQEKSPVRKAAKIQVRKNGRPKQILKGKRKRHLQNLGRKTKLHAGSELLIMYQETNGNKTDIFKLQEPANEKRNTVFIPFLILIAEHLVGRPRR